MTEEKRREHLAHLVHHVEMPVEEAEDLVHEDDEWVVEPEVRFYVPVDELVQEWEYAVGQLSHLAVAASGGGLFDSVVVGICLADVEERARAALRRTRKRARQAREGE
jgi:hypothetical protein